MAVEKHSGLLISLEQTCCVMILQDEDLVLRSYHESYVFLSNFNIFLDSFDGVGGFKIEIAILITLSKHVG